MSKNERLHEFVNECMVIALVELMQVKPLDKITVTELTEKAGVGRVSFYRSFGSKEAVLRSYIKSLFDTTTVLEGIYDAENLVASIEKKLRIIRENAPFFLLLTQENLVWLFFDEMYSIASENITAHHLNKNKYQPFFYAGATISVLVQWIRSGMRESAAELAEIIVELIKGYMY